MTILTPVDNWVDVVQLETEDIVLGGVSGKSNEQAQQLLNRTEWLKNNAGGAIQNGSSIFGGINIPGVPIAKHITLSPEITAPYLVVITPTANTGGYLGDVWCENKANNGFDVKNTGSGVTAFDWAVFLK